MDYITTTELRYKASKLKDSLKAGKSTYIVHRSTVIGVIAPTHNKEYVTVNAKTLKSLIDKLATGRGISFERAKSQYVKHLKNKYGKNIS